MACFGWIFPASRQKCVSLSCARRSASTLSRWMMPCGVAHLLYKLADEVVADYMPVISNEE